MIYAETDIRKYLINCNCTEKILRIYSLSKFCLNSIVDSEKLSEEWCSLIKLSKYGKIIYDKISSELQVTSKCLFFQLFSTFSWEDVFLLFDDIDEMALEKLLNKEILKGSIKFPFIYGRLLYDKYNDLMPGRKDKLTVSETSILLGDTPRGIFQLGKILVGPLGILESKEYRIIPPTIKIPLWHCEDPGCMAVHSVNISSEAIFTTILNLIRGYAGIRANWRGILNTYIRKQAKKTSRFSFYDIASFIGNCFIEKEISIIFEKALKMNSINSDLMSIISMIKKLKSRSPKDICTEFDMAEKIQLLLFINDFDLIKLIESAIDEKLLHIPFGQIRKARWTPTLPSYSYPTELSCFGFRSLVNAPILNVMWAIERVYSHCNRLSDLEWKFNVKEQNNFISAIYNTAAFRNPEELIELYILCDKEICDKFMELFNVSVDPIKNKKILINRLLWRLGYEPVVFDELISNLKENLKDVKEYFSSLKEPLKKEEKERIRSKGVNLFVLVEEFLENIITFNTWCLGSDHYLDTRCYYSTRDSINFVPIILGDKICIEGNDFYWSTKGTNTIGVLLVYMNSLRKWVKSLSKENSESLLRDEMDIPFYNGIRYDEFPYHHKQMWADINRNELESYIDNIDALLGLINGANIPYVRNGIDHKRDEDSFPSINRMIECVDSLLQASDTAIKYKLYPNLVILKKNETIRQGAKLYTFEDLFSKKYEVYGPSIFSDVLNISYKRCCIIAPFKLSQAPNSQLVFSYKNINEYDDYWSGYPRRLKTTYKINAEETLD